MNSQQFKALFLPLQSAMQLLAERLLGDADQAEDIVQEAFITLWERRNQLKQSPNPQGYAMLTVRNRCLDQLRRRNRQKAYDAELRLLSDQAVTLEIEERQDNAARVMQLLQALPPKQRRAVEMKYLEARSTEEMQRELGMSPANIYTTLSRGMQTLRNLLSETGNE